MDVNKLRDYCLSLNQEDGKHKARVFGSVLGLHQADAIWLRDRLLDALLGDALLVAVTFFGTLYVIDFQLRPPRGEATVRSGWIIRVGEDFPRLTTCFVKKDKRP